MYHGSLNTSQVRVSNTFFARRSRSTQRLLIVADDDARVDASNSPEDVAVTRALVEAGKLLDIDVLDHLVIGRYKFVSLKERGLGFAAERARSRWAG